MATDYTLVHMIRDYWREFLLLDASGKFLMPDVKFDAQAGTIVSNLQPDGYPPRRQHG